MAITIIPRDYTKAQMNQQAIMDALKIFMGMQNLGMEKEAMGADIQYKEKTGEAALTNAEANRVQALASAKHSEAQAEQIYWSISDEKSRKAYAESLIGDPETDENVKLYMTELLSGGRPNMPQAAYPAVQTETSLNRQSEMAQTQLRELGALERTKLQNAVSLAGQKDYRQTELGRGMAVSRQYIDDENDRHNSVLARVFTRPGLADLVDPKTAYYAWRQNPRMANVTPQQAAAFSEIDRIVREEEALHEINLKQLEQESSWYKQEHMRGLGYEEQPAAVPSPPREAPYSSGGQPISALGEGQYGKALEQVQQLIEQLGEDKVRIGEDQFVYLKDASGTERKYGFSSDGTLYAVR